MSATVPTSTHTTAIVYGLVYNEKGEFIVDNQGNLKASDIIGHVRSANYCYMVRRDEGHVGEIVEVVFNFEKAIVTECISGRIHKIDLRMRLYDVVVRAVVN